MDQSESFPLRKMRGNDTQESRSTSEPGQLVPISINGTLGTLRSRRAMAQGVKAATKPMMPSPRSMVLSPVTRSTSRLSWSVGRCSSVLDSKYVVTNRRSGEKGMVGP